MAKKTERNRRRYSEQEGALLLRSGPWLAHLTPEAVRELGLRAGKGVWLVVKTHSWRVVAG